MFSWKRFSLCQYRHKTQANTGEEQKDTIDNKIVTEKENVEKSKGEMEHLDEISAEDLLTHTFNFIYTSTPKKRKLSNCEGCSKQSQCEDCYLDDYVDNYMTKSNLTK